MIIILDYENPHFRGTILDYGHNYGLQAFPLPGYLAAGEPLTM